MSNTIAKIRRVFVLCAAMSLGMAPLADAWAQGPPTAERPAPPAERPAPPVGQKVDIEVKVVYATNSNDKMDPRLAPMANQLKILSFRGFELIGTQTTSLSVGQEHTFTIEGGRRLTVELVSKDDKKATLRVKSFTSQSAQRIDTTVGVPRNRYFMLAGPAYRDGVLVLPVSAKY